MNKYNPKPDGNVAPKYGFTGRRKYFQEWEVEEIIALRDFGNVKKGERGGWIQTEKNLSHAGTCWIGPECYGLDVSRIEDNALITGKNISLRAFSRAGDNVALKGCDVSLYRVSGVTGNAIIRANNLKLLEQGMIGGDLVAKFNNVTIRHQCTINKAKLLLAENTHIKDADVVLRGKRGALKLTALARPVSTPITNNQAPAP